MFIEYLRYKVFEMEEDFNKIIADCQNMISIETQKVEVNDREDFRQELIMRLYKVLQKEIISINDEFIIEESIGKVKNNYYKNFLEDINKSKKISEDNKNLLFESEFFVFVGEIKLRAYLKRVCYTFTIDYFRKNKRDLYNQCLRLNNVNNEGHEYIETIRSINPYSENKNLVDFLKKTINEQDLNFLLEAYKCKSQKEYADKLNVTQQYVSKKTNRIIRMIKNQLQK